MTTTTTAAIRRCDVLVIGAGAGGLATAITARKQGLEVIVIEKDAYFGGTTAFSGGVLWIPGNQHKPGGKSVADSREAMETYLKSETGAFYNEAAVKLFLDNAPQMVEWFERETAVRFVPTMYPAWPALYAPGSAVVHGSPAAPAALRASPVLPADSA